MKVRSAKQKGRTGQSEVVELIRKHTGLNEDECYSRPASLTGNDIVLSRRGKKVFPYSVEVKRQEKLSIWAWLKQMESNTLEDETGLLVFRRNNGKWYVTLDFEKFLTLLDKINIYNPALD